MEAALHQSPAPAAFVMERPMRSAKNVAICVAFLFAILRTSPVLTELSIPGPACPMGSSYADGCTVASAGGAPLPNLLMSYAAPPPWNVAGVDYAVGVSRGVALKDPRTAALPTGCSLSGTTVTCSGTVSLEGYDFSLHKGTTLALTGGDVTVRDCLFTVGTNQGRIGKIVDVSGATNVLFIYNEFDGANIEVLPQRGQTINVRNVGEITFRYNYFHNSGGDMIDFGGGPQVNIVQYNLFEDIGLKTAHSDTLQWCGSIVQDSDISFNTIVQTAPGLSGMGLLTVNSECAGARMSNVLVHNNTLISKVSDNFIVGADVTQAAGPASADHVAVFDNYADVTGIMALTSSPWFPTGYYGYTLPVPCALHSMVNMRTGSLIPPQTKSNSSPVAPYYYVYPDSSGYTPSQSDVYSISASPASGTVMVGSTIIFTLSMDERWIVTGSPRLLLNSGGAANYSSGSGSSKLIFTHTIAAGQSVDELAVTGLDLDGGSISDRAGNHVNMENAFRTFPSLSVH